MDLTINGVIVRGGRDWLVCTPGELEHYQRTVIAGMAGENSYQAEFYNTRSGYIMFTIFREHDGSTDVYTIGPNAIDVRYVTTVTAEGEKEQR